MPLAVAVLALAGCGGGSDTKGSSPTLEDDVAAVKGLSGAARTAKLEQLAQDEGGDVTLYTSSAVSYMDEVAGAFEDAHDIDVSLYKTSSEALVQRMIEEHKAGFRGSDVAEANTPNLVPLTAEGILAPYSSPAATGLVAGSIGDTWTGDKFNTFIVAWNTKRVPRGQEPRSYEDLADPRWKGRLVLEADDSDWYKTLWEHLVATGTTPEEADRIFSGIASNATFVNGHNLMTELVAAGEFDVTPDAYLHTVKGLVDDGAPLAWQPAVTPVISRPDGIAIVKDARHPAAAMLFVDFVLGQGQKLFVDAGLTPARKGLGVPTSIEQIAMDVPDYVAHADEWTKRYEQLVRLGKVAPESG